MTAAHRRHDMTGDVWERLRPHLPGGEGQRGRPAHDNRRFIDAVCRILRTGAPPHQVRGRLWRDLPPDYGDWKNTHRPPGLTGGLKASAADGTGACGRTVGGSDGCPRFRVADDRRRLYQEPAPYWIRGPSPQRRRPGRESVHFPHKRGLNSKLHLVVDSHGMPVRLAVTGGTVADCSRALALIEGIKAECLPADKAYDTRACPISQGRFRISSTRAI